MAYDYSKVNTYFRTAVSSAHLVVASGGGSRYLDHVVIGVAGTASRVSLQNAAGTVTYFNITTALAGIAEIDMHLVVPDGLLLVNTGTAVADLTLIYR